MEERQLLALWRGRRRPALPGRLAGLPPVHPHRLYRRRGRHCARHCLPQRRRQLDAADLEDKSGAPNYSLRVTSIKAERRARRQSVARWSSWQGRALPLLE
ncbi:hypothetical protein MPLSOD_40917 [Mesorhizobium sp. SOD10]|nr:hypothetical protein MPLSOD_40917 [Mesorhizobium sp. SOD10]